VGAKRKIEVEAKYRVNTPGGADRYLVAPDLGPFAADGPVRSVRVEDRYIDTTDWALAKAGFAARMRKTSRVIEIHLKALSSAGTHIQRRQEVEGQANASLIAADWPVSRARSLILELCGEEALAELLTIRQLRRVRRLRAGRVRAELSVDEVEVVADGRVLDTFEELEVELKSGNEAPLATLADLLNHDDGLTALSTSKLERAVETVRAAAASMPAALRERWDSAPAELLTGRPEPEAEVAAEVPSETAPETRLDTAPTPKSGARRLGIRAEDTMQEAALKVLGLNFSRLKNREAGTRRGLDPEELHDMRVAARRMGAAWQVFDSAFKAGKTKRLRRRLDEITRRLGAARDLDVLTVGLDAYHEALDEAKGLGLEPLRSAWRHQRSATRAALVRELGSDRYRSFIKEMAIFLDEGARDAAHATAPTMPHRVRDRAPSEIWASYQSVRAYELVLAWADIETVHSLRLEAKRLRYSLEFFGEALGPESDGLLQKVAALQDHLGALNDADVASNLARNVLIARAGELSKVERDAIGTYLRTREREVARRRRSLGPIWRAVNGASFRLALGRAIAAL